MKINPQELSSIAQPQKILKQPDAATGRFDAFLEKAMAPQSVQAPSTGILPPLQNLSNLNFAVPAGVELSQAVRQTDEVLNLIESYRNKLADPNASLKEVYPLVQQMEKKSAELIPVWESLPDGDKLKDVLNRIIVTSTVEAIKFNRGDYV